MFFFSGDPLVVGRVDENRNVDGPEILFNEGLHIFPVEPAHSRGNARYSKTPDGFLLQLAHQIFKTVPDVDGGCATRVPGISLSGFLGQQVENFSMVGALP